MYLVFIPEKMCVEFQVAAYFTNVSMLVTACGGGSSNDNKFILFYGPVDRCPHVKYYSRVIRKKIASDHRFINHIAAADQVAV